MTANNSEHPKDLFGYYCTIEMKRHGVPNENYQHKIIGRFKSNAWVDVPIQSPAKAEIHDHSEEVIDVICCGVVEETVYRVKLSDAKNIHSHLPKADLVEYLNGLRRKYLKSHPLGDLEPIFDEIIKYIQSK